MKYDKKAKIIKLESISDGMGGWIDDGENVLKSFDSFITPLKADVLLKEYGISSTTTIKLFTKEELNIRNDGTFDNLKVQVNGENYKIVQFSDFGKVRMLLLELIL